MLLSKLQATLLKGTLSLLLLVSVAIGAYFYGKNDGVNISKAEISQYEKQVSDLNSQLQTALADIKVETVTKYLTNTNTITEVVYRNRDVIKQQIVPVQYSLSNGFVYTYNQTVLGLPVDEAKAADPSPSGVMDAEALDTIIANVGVGHLNAEQLSGLQDYIIKKNEAIEDIQP